MKRVHIHTDCQFFAGCENMIASLLNDKGLNTSVRFSLSYRFTKAYAEGLEKRLTNENIQICPIKLWLGKPLSNKLLILLNILLTPILILYDVVLLFKLFRKVSPDMLFINNGGYPGARSCRSAVVAAKLAGIKEALFYVNNITAPYNSILRILDIPLDCFVKRSVTNFITASKFAGDSLSEVLKIKRESILHICNTFEKKPIAESRQRILSKINVSNGQVVVGSVGLLDKRKGHNYVIEAMSLLRTKFNCHKYKLIIIGVGSEKENLEELINKYKLSESVRIIPHQDNIFDYYNSFDIFVLAPVAYDDFPFTVREAMSMSLPIVSTHFAGIPEIVEDDRNGFLVERRNPHELASSLRKLIEDKKLRESFGYESRKIYETKLSHEKIMESYGELFNRVQ